MLAVVAGQAAEIGLKGCGASGRRSIALSREEMELTNAFGVPNEDKIPAAAFASLPAIREDCLPIS